MEGGGRDGTWMGLQGTKEERARWNDRFSDGIGKIFGLPDTIQSPNFAQIATTRTPIERPKKAALVAVSNTWALQWAKRILYNVHKP